MKLNAILCFVMFFLFSCKDSSPPSNREKIHGSTKVENALIDRFRKDLVLTNKNIPDSERERQVQKFSSDIEYANTHEYPSNHSECINFTKTWPNYDCTLVVGNETKPKWFNMCRSTGGQVVSTATPSGTPLHYDSEICTKTYAIK